MARKAKRKAKAKPKARKKLVATVRIKAAAKKSAARAAKGAPIHGSAARKKAPSAKVEKFTLYAMFPSAPSSKVGLMLSMCGARFDYKHMNLQAGAHKTPEYLVMNPSGQVPTLQHGDRYIRQSNTILRYLADHFGRFGGRSDAEKLRISEWLNWDMDLMATGIGITRFVTKFMPQEEALGKFMRGRGERALGILDKHLGASKFMVGAAPTIADIAIFPWVAFAEEGGFAIANWPNVQAWAERLLTYPGVGHPYAIMPKEDRITG